MRENNLSKLVKFKGNLKEKDLIKWFENIDIYFHLILFGIYLDFGYHPGKDRMPREAALFNNCIITISN